MGRKKKLQDARIEQQRLLAIQARAAYQSGREEYLKLLLNQEHPEKFSRTLTYYDYINKAASNSSPASTKPSASWPTSSRTSLRRKPNS
ncbi:peptidase M23B [Pseudomonas aeruginosa]|nr:peptidase M23B [Pseudomonas aeruginosa]